MEVLEISAYSSANIFKEYVETLYASRRKYTEDGNPAFAFMCKILLNSLYGKFGQRGNVWTDVRQATEEDPLEWLEQARSGDPVDKYRVRAGMVQVKLRDAESGDSFPAIAAHVTAHGRMLLWEMMQTAGQENTFYCDTDSMIVNEEGYQRVQHLVDQKQLGMLKLEHESTDTTLFGPKDYLFADLEKHKGIRANATRLADATWEQIQFNSWDWHLSKGEEGFIYVDTIRKHLHRIYKKGIVGASGWVTPLRLP